jgi:hypothetical protein
MRSVVKTSRSISVVRGPSWAGGWRSSSHSPQARYEIEQVVVEDAFHEGQAFFGADVGQDRGLKKFAVKGQGPQLQVEVKAARARPLMALEPAFPFRTGQVLVPQEFEHGLGGAAMAAQWRHAAALGCQLRAQAVHGLAQSLPEQRLDLVLPGKHAPERRVGINDLAIGVKDHHTDGQAIQDGRSRAVGDTFRLPRQCFKGRAFGR